MRSRSAKLNADEIQEKSQVPTIAVTSYPNDLWIVDMFRIVGAVTGKDEKARDLIAYAEEKVDEITEITSKIPDEDKPVVYTTHPFGLRSGHRPLSAGGEVLAEEGSGAGGSGA